MTIKVLVKREKHKQPVLGQVTCSRCDSSLLLEKSDLSQRVGEILKYFPCPVCDNIIYETNVLWYDADLEERAKNAFYKSQSNLHNLQTTAWHEASEQTRAEWRARVK